MMYPLTDVDQSHSLSARPTTSATPRLLRRDELVARAAAS